jgi:hypothetical protein
MRSNASFAFRERERLDHRPDARLHGEAERVLGILRVAARPRAKRVALQEHRHRVQRQRLGDGGQEQELPPDAQARHDVRDRLPRSAPVATIAFAPPSFASAAPAEYFRRIRRSRRHRACAPAAPCPRRARSQPCGNPM